MIDKLSKEEGAEFLSESLQKSLIKLCIQLNRKKQRRRMFQFEKFRRFGGENLLTQFLWIERKKKKLGAAASRKKIIGKDSVREMQSDEVYWKISLSLAAERLADGWKRDSSSVKKFSRSAKRRNWKDWREEGNFLSAPYAPSCLYVSFPKIGRMFALKLSRLNLWIFAGSHVLAWGGIKPTTQLGARNGLTEKCERNIHQERFNVASNE